MTNVLSPSEEKVSCHLANAMRLVIRGLRVDLNDFRPNPNLRRRKTVIEMIFIPFRAGQHVFSSENLLQIV